MCLVGWPLNESEAGVDLVLIETSPLFSYVNDAVLMQLSWNLREKSIGISIKTRSTQTSLSFKGQATKHTTVKWYICNDFSLVELMGRSVVLTAQSICVRSCSSDTGECCQSVIP